MKFGFEFCFENDEISLIFYRYNQKFSKKKIKNTKIQIYTYPNYLITH